MQGSFLANTTPPFCMENSLINSSDFSNINFLSNPSDQEEEEDAESSPMLDETLDLMKIKMNGYSFANVISDTKFLENLCDETFLKDENISKTDCILTDSAGDGSSANSTLQNSEIFANNDIFVAPVAATTNGNTTHISTDEMNGTFCLTSAATNGAEHDVANEIFTQNDIIKNTTYPRLLDATFDGGLLETPQQPTHFDGGITMNGTFTAAGHSTDEEKRYHTPESDFKTKLAARKSMDNITPIRKIYNFSGPDDGDLTLIDVNLMSTPMSQASHHANPKTTLTHNTDDDHDDGDDELVELRQKRPPPPPKRQISIGDDFEPLEKERLNHQREEDQRNSLFNFVEFEKSISLLENRASVDEKEFDNILNALTNTDNRMMNERMRQNLDNIKKRHSLANQEKMQQHHQEAAASMRKSIVSNQTPEFVDTNTRLNESIKSTMSTSSGSGERLLNRRSRIFDEVAEASGAPAAGGSATEKEGRTEKHNRDRYKTIRIFRKPGDPEMDLPNADEPYPDNVVSSGLAAVNLAEPEMAPPSQTSSLPRSSAVIKKSGLTRPKFFGSKQNLQIYQPLKSSSADDLLDRNYEGHGRSQSPAASNMSSKTVPKSSEKIKSPMGVKAKSFHNIATNNSTMYGGHSAVGSPKGMIGGGGGRHVNKLSFVSQKSTGYGMRDNEVILCFLIVARHSLFERLNHFF